MKISEMLEGYLEDGGFTGSSMSKTIDKIDLLPAKGRDRLHALLLHFQGWGWKKEDLLVAVRWAKEMEEK